MSSSFSDPALILPEAVRFNELNNEIFCIERYDNHLGTEDNFLETAVVGTGSTTESASAHRREISSGTTDTSSATYRSKTQYTIGAYHTVFNCKLSGISSGTTNSKTAYIGLFNAVGTPASAIAFFWDTDNAWYCRTASQTLGGTTDTAITAVVTDDHLTIVVSVLNGVARAKFFVNGVMVASHTTNIETVFSMNLGAFTRCGTGGAVQAKTILISQFGFEKYPLV